jgi:hypothetical protein
MLYDILSVSVGVIKQENHFCVIRPEAFLLGIKKLHNEAVALQWSTLAQIIILYTVFKN